MAVVEEHFRREYMLIDAKDFMTNLLAADFPDCSDWKRRCLAVKQMLEKYDNTEGNDAVEAIVFRTACADLESTQFRFANDKAFLF